MVITEDQAHLDIHEFITSKETTLHCVLDSLLDRLDVFLRDRATGNLVFEDKALAGRRLDLDLNVSKLTTTTRLFLVDFFPRRRLSDGLAIGNLRFADIRFDAKLALHPIHDDFEMQLTHAGDDGLA